MEYVLFVMCENVYMIYMSQIKRPEHQNLWYINIISYLYI